MSLVLEEVTRRFGRQTALDGVSLEVRRGDCYGFLGHNGAGKTTAMRIALGLVRADAGRVLVDGLDARREPREARARMGGLIEVPGFHGHLDGRANLELLGGLGGLDRAERRREAQRLLELVGLDGAGRKPVGAYSQGMRQRLGIAQALVGRPAYVLLDEPTNGLDPEGIAEMRGLLRRLTREEGVTALVSSHQLGELSEVCNRVGILREGRLLVQAETAVLLAREGVEYVVAGEDSAALERALRELDLEPRAVGADGAARRVALGERAPAEVAAALVRAGVALRAFAPEPPSLEAIYLRASRGEVVAPSEAPERAAGTDAATERRTPTRPGIVRALGYELGRWRAGLAGLWFLALPALLALAAVARRLHQAREGAAAVDAGETFSATRVTAFEGVAVALQAALPLVALVVAGFASQSIAGERARGTLRNVALRPLRRGEWVLGKLLAVLLAALAAYALAALAAAGASAWALDFGDVVEELPGGQRYPLVKASALWPELTRALATPVAAVAAYAALGFLAGALARGAAAAVGIALGSVALLDLARVVARAFDVERWLPSAYLPSPLGDTSPVQTFLDLAQGVSNPIRPYAATAWSVPLAWTAGATILAVAIAARRPID